MNAVGKLALAQRGVLSYQWPIAFKAPLEPNHPLLSAALAERYQVLHEIGAGGMATVYLARDLKHDRDVALKVLRPELTADERPNASCAPLEGAAVLTFICMIPEFVSDVWIIDNFDVDMRDRVW